MRNIIKQNHNTTLQFFVVNDVQSAVNIQKFEKSILVSDFFNNNGDFWSRIHEYHYVKFNYFMIRFPEITYCSYSAPVSTALAKTAVAGINSFNTDRYPFHVAWDIEQNLDWDAQGQKFGASELSEYVFAKKVYPGQKRAPYFIWKVPAQWRGYYDTKGAMGSMFTNIPLYVFFQNLTGIKNLRSPVNIFGGHENWWAQTLPNTVKPSTKPTDADYVFMESFLKIEFICSYTLRGRRFIGGNTPN